jgi:hypothetical protein
VPVHRPLTSRLRTAAPETAQCELLLTPANKIMGHIFTGLLREAHIRQERRQSERRSSGLERSSKASFLPPPPRPLPSECTRKYQAPLCSSFVRKQRNLSMRLSAPAPPPHTQCGRSSHINSVLTLLIILIGLLIVLSTAACDRVSKNALCR